MGVGGGTGGGGCIGAARVAWSAGAMKMSMMVAVGRAVAWRSRAGGAHRRQLTGAVVPGRRRWAGRNTG
jgi:hypothetical protein